VDRYYDDGTVIKQQTKRNRTTNLITGRAGMDWYANKANTFTVSGFYSREGILDRGDEPFFNQNLDTRLRLWQFLEDEVKTTITAYGNWRHQFAQPGRMLNFNFNYTFHREDEQYYFTNIYPSYTGLDSFILISDEHVGDATLDYVQPLKHGRIEAGGKFRRREIPINMRFIPGLNSPLDSNAGGYAKYNETVSALYLTYVYESNKFEVEAGLRGEYANIRYDVNPNHNTYKSDGYDYLQPFPNLRLTYKLNNRNRISFFFTRRVDRPNEVDIRIFPKYDDAEIIKVGNPSLQPQYVISLEAGYKTSWDKGYLYTAVYHKIIDGTITRIASTTPGSYLIYNVFQNAGRSFNSGVEIVFAQKLNDHVRFDLNLLGYKNVIEAFSVVNLYPTPQLYNAQKQEIYSGNVKLNGYLNLPKGIEAQLTAIYLAPDIIPQGRIGDRFSIDAGLKKSIQKGKGELFVNATDIANTLRIKQEIQGDGFRFVSNDYYETQVFRVGWNYKF
ncbi:MAG: TonB-dependent receptor family protein, partial [Chitinophagaceae bacterium]|nr:TonB-dependent receptor family protein [Chitinophagaceae bacterium]